MTDRPAELDPQFDHVGIAVPDDAAAASQWEETTGLAAGPSERVGSTHVTYLGAANGIELVAPAEDAGPIARFLDARGPGLHHLALRIDDVDAAIERGAIDPDTIVDGPRDGALGHRVAFRDPAVTDEVLVEFVSTDER